MIWKRIKNLWKMSELEPWEKDRVPKEGDTIIQSLIRPKATFIKHEPIDPIKRITESQ